MRARTAAPVAAALALVAAETGAQRCAVANVDLAASFRALPGVVAVSTSRRRDADSREPVLRHVLDQDDGATVVVEQQNCRIRNLRVTLLSPHEHPRPSELRRAGRALGATPVWKRYFGRHDPAAMLAREPLSAEWRAKGAARQFSYAADSRFSAAGEASEVTAAFMHTDAHVAQYRSALTLSISVGGAP